jgi:hypothetical protein
VNVTGVSPATVAVAVWVPAFGPSVRVVLATPVASVVLEPGATAPPPEATAQFTVANAYRRAGNDRFMLDNEPLDAYKTFWGDDEVFRFWSEMRKLGVPPALGIEYCPAYLTRSRGRWPKLMSLREEGLAIQWVSYGDMDAEYEEGEEPNTTGTGLDNPEMHQFTSSYRIPGYSGNVDRVYSRLTVSQLFGGEMGYLEVRPARGRITNPFGAPPATPTSPPSHLGQDYGWGGGDEIFAARGGLVTATSRVGSYGNRVVINHGGGRETWYCHIRDGGFLVSVGDVVNAGQQIAWMGATGNVTAKHLHFELRINGAAVNPEPYFAGSGTAGGGTTPIEEDDMFDDDARRKLDWVVNAIGAGGADNGVIPSKDTVLGIVRDDLRNQVTNINRQVAGAPPFDPAQSVAGRVIDIQKKVTTGGVDVAALAKLVVEGVLAGLPKGTSLTEAQVEAAVRRVFADAAE